MYNLHTGYHANWAFVLCALSPDYGGYGGYEGGYGARSGAPRGKGTLSHPTSL